ncbi:MAG: hypothetical protein NC399_09105 [Muribaculum sp.]|nr:hypothetical protein [Muribaculum sp.]
MDKTILQQINDLFDSGDLFSGSGMQRIRDNVKEKFPDTDEDNLKELENYLEGFYDYCMEFGSLLAGKYKTPFLPSEEAVLKEIAEYVADCQKRYPEMDENHIMEVFSTACWLSNR